MVECRLQRILSCRLQGVSLRKDYDDKLLRVLRDSVYFLMKYSGVDLIKLYKTYKYHVKYKLAAAVLICTFLGKLISCSMCTVSKKRQLFGTPHINAIIGVNIVSIEYVIDTNTDISHCNIASQIC